MWPECPPDTLEAEVPPNILIGPEMRPFLSATLRELTRHLERRLQVVAPRLGFTQPVEHRRTSLKHTLAVGLEHVPATDRPRKIEWQPLPAADKVGVQDALVTEKPLAHLVDDNRRTSGRESGQIAQTRGRRLKDHDPRVEGRALTYAWDGVRKRHSSNLFWRLKRERVEPIKPFDHYHIRVEGTTRARGSAQYQSFA